MNILWSVLLLFAGPPASGAVPAASPAAKIAGEITVPIQVAGPGEEKQLHHAEISVFLLSQQGGRARRGKLVVRGTTGAKGDPFVARLAPSADRLLVEAREIGGGKPVLGSTVIALDREVSAWRPQGKIPARTQGQRPSEVLPERTGQQPIVVRIPERARARIYVIAS